MSENLTQHVSIHSGNGEADLKPQKSLCDLDNVGCNFKEAERHPGTRIATSTSFLHICFLLLMSTQLKSIDLFGGQASVHNGHVVLRKRAFINDK